MYENLLKAEDVGLEKKKNPIIEKLNLMHFSPKKNRKSILKNGLIINQDPSGYGPPPKHNAVYLFHPNNINIIYDLVETGDEIDIWEIRNIDKSKLIPDEDSKAKTWEGSLQRFGTVAYTEVLPPEKLELVLTVLSPKSKLNK